MSSSRSRCQFHKTIGSFRLVKSIDRVWADRNLVSKFFSLQFDRKCFSSSTTKRHPISIWKIFCANLQHFNSNSFLSFSLGQVDFRLIFSWLEKKNEIDFFLQIEFSFVRRFSKFLFIFLCNERPPLSRGRFSFFLDHSTDFIWTERKIDSVSCRFYLTTNLISNRKENHEYLNEIDWFYRINLTLFWNFTEKRQNRRNFRIDHTKISGKFSWIATQFFSIRKKHLKTKKIYSAENFSIEKILFISCRNLLKETNILLLRLNINNMNRQTYLLRPKVSMADCLCWILLKIVPMKNVFRKPT